jgi:hypothetical protein
MDRTLSLLLQQLHLYQTIQTAYLGALGIVLWAGRHCKAAEPRDLEQADC